MPKPTPQERFWVKVEKSYSCWLWTGAKAAGYGRFWSGERVVPAHRFAYEQLVGPVADEMDLDHLCRNPSCVNPAHLEPVTHRVNILRGTGFSARNAAKTHCSKGHPLSGGNLYVLGNGRRKCRACMGAGWMKYHAANRARKNERSRAYYRANRDRLVQYARDKRAAKKGATSAVSEP